MKDMSKTEARLKREKRLNVVFNIEKADERAILEFIRNSDFKFSVLVKMLLKQAMQNGVNQTEMKVFGATTPTPPSKAVEKPKPKAIEDPFIFE